MRTARGVASRRVRRARAQACDVYAGASGERIADRRSRRHALSLSRSYTGEDVVEISAHGSPLLLSEIVRAAIEHGARLAEPGEFTLRAFLNGRMDLPQAEAVADLVNAVTPGQARAAFDQLNGTLTTTIAEIEHGLFDLVAKLEASLDFPDEGYHFLAPDEARSAIDRLAARIDALVAGARRGRAMREGRVAAICGRPNVGKSSLFNCLLGFDRAIVTAIEGTTRDLVDERLDIEGVPVRIVDTAGMRNAIEEVEAEGIARAARAVDTADVVVVMVDRSRALEAADRDLCTRTRGRPRVLVANKSDLPAAWPLDALDAGAIELSLATGDGLETVRRAIGEAAGAGADRTRSAVSHERQAYGAPRTRARGARTRGERRRRRRARGDRARGSRRRSRRSRGSDRCANLGGSAEAYLSEFLHRQVTDYDVIVIGAGHAGCEAAWAAARIGVSVAICTMSRETVALMPCNPAIGGTAKGHLVREIDALGGLMGRAIDATGLQFKILNRTRGPAVWSPRAQADKKRYAAWMRETLDREPRIDWIVGAVARIETDAGHVSGLALEDGRTVPVRCSGRHDRHVPERADSHRPRADRRGSSRRAFVAAACRIAQVVRVPLRTFENRDTAAAASREHRLLRVRRTARRRADRAVLIPVEPARAGADRLPSPSHERGRACPRPGAYRRIAALQRSDQRNRSAILPVARRQDHAVP